MGRRLFISHTLSLSPACDLKRRRPLIRLVPLQIVSHLETTLLFRSIPLDSSVARRPNRASDNDEIEGAAAHQRLQIGIASTSTESASDENDDDDE